MMGSWQTVHTDACLEFIWYKYSFLLLCFIIGEFQRVSGELVFLYRVFLKLFYSRNNILSYNFSISMLFGFYKTDSDKEVTIKLDELLKHFVMR